MTDVGLRASLGGQPSLGPTWISKGDDPNAVASEAAELMRGLLDLLAAVEQDQPGELADLRAQNVGLREFNAELLSNQKNHYDKRIAELEARLQALQPYLQG